MKRRQPRGGKYSVNIKTEARDVVGSGERGGLTCLCDIHSILTSCWEMGTWGTSEPSVRCLWAL